MKWYLVDSGEMNGEENMATDLAMMDVAKEGTPILRLYGWNPPSLSLGKFQRAEEINFDYLREKGYSVVRRPSGGRAVLHQDEVTYAVTVPEHMLFKSVIRSYLEISRALVEGLNAMGLRCKIAREHSKERYTDFAACFATTSIHEIMIDGRKLVGSAQTRKDGVILQHGSIPMKCHFEEYANCFSLLHDHSEDLKKRLENSTTCVLEHKSLNFEDVKRAIIIGFEKVLEVKFVPFDDEFDWKKYVTDVKVWD